MEYCDRCCCKTNFTTMSYFTTASICMDCDKKEREHPRFKEAQDAEMAQIRQGNYNFKGIGKPKDL